MEIYKKYVEIIVYIKYDFYTGEFDTICATDTTILEKHLFNGIVPYEMSVESIIEEFKNYALLRLSFGTLFFNPQYCNLTNIEISNKIDDIKTKIINKFTTNFTKKLVEDGYIYVVNDKIMCSILQCSKISKYDLHHDTCLLNKHLNMKEIIVFVYYDSRCIRDLTLLYDIVRLEPYDKLSTTNITMFYLTRRIEK